MYTDVKRCSSNRIREGDLRKAKKYYQKAVYCSADWSIGIISRLLLYRKRDLPLFI